MVLILIDQSTNRSFDNSINRTIEQSNNRSIDQGDLVPTAGGSGAATDADAAARAREGLITRVLDGLEVYNRRLLPNGEDARA